MKWALVWRQVVGMGGVCAEQAAAIVEHDPSVARNDACAEARIQ